MNQVNRSTARVIIIVWVRFRSTLAALEDFLGAFSRWGELGRKCSAGR